MRILQLIEAKNMKWLIVLIGLMFSASAMAQQKEWPPAEWKDTSLRRFSGRATTWVTRNFKGYMVMKSGDTTRGYMERRDKVCRILPVGKFEYKEIPYDQIRFIWADIASFGKDHIELTNQYWEKPLRLMAEKGSVLLYDNADLTAADRLGAPLILVTDGKPVKIYDYGQFYKHQRHIRKLVVNFVNKRYGVALPKDYFKTNQEVVDYLVDKENERLRGEGK